MAEAIESTDQGACLGEYTSPGNSTGVKVMVDKEGKYLTDVRYQIQYGLYPRNGQNGRRCEDTIGYR